MDRSRRACWKGLDFDVRPPSAYEKSDRVTHGDEPHANRGGRCHIRSLVGDKHIRDWTAEDLGRVVARTFRSLLLRAGVTRRELHEALPTRQPITFRDLRATRITWQAVRGDEPMRIMQRAGHSDFETTMRYVRTAEELREGFGDVLPELPESLMEGANVQVKRTRTIPDSASWREESWI
jgi:hypothetical protein